MRDSTAIRRVALLSLHSSPLGPAGSPDVGGMNLYVRRLAEDLAARDIFVDVFTRRTDGSLPEIVPISPRARVIHLSAGPHRRLPKAALPPHIPAMTSALRAFAHSGRLQYDILHSHYWISGQVAMRYLMLQTNPAPWLHMFHTLSRVKEFYLGEPDTTDSSARFEAERCIIGRADVIVGSTEEEERDLRALYGRSPRRYAIIPPAVDHSLFFPRGQRAARRRLGLGDGRVVLFTGRRDRLKRLDLLLRAVATLPASLREDLTVVLVGDHDAAGIARLANSLRIAGSVDVRGRVDQRDLPWYYAAADLCAVPSAHESFGMVALEAMACGTPVLAFRVGGLASTIEHERTGLLVAGGGSLEYGTALRRALEEVDLATLGRAAARAARRFSWDTVTDQTIELYRDLRPVSAELAAIG